MTSYWLHINVKGSTLGHIIGIRIRESMSVVYFLFFPPAITGRKLTDELHIDTEHPHTADTDLGWKDIWLGCVEGGR